MIFKIIDLTSGMQLPQNLCICTDLHWKADEQKPYVEKSCFAWPVPSDASLLLFPPGSFLQSQGAHAGSGTPAYRTQAAPWTPMSCGWGHGHPTQGGGSRSCCPRWCCRICSPGPHCSCGSGWRISATSSSSRVMGLPTLACCSPSAVPSLSLSRGHPPLQW